MNFITPFTTAIAGRIAPVPYDHRNPVTVRRVIQAFTAQVASITRHLHVPNSIES